MSDCFPIDEMGFHDQSFNEAILKNQVRENSVEGEKKITTL